MTNTQKNFLTQLANATDWTNAENVKSASEQLINKFNEDYPSLDESKSESIQKVLYEGLYTWLEYVMDYFQEQQIDGTCFWNNMLSKVNGIYTKGIGFLMANYIVFAQSARQYSENKDIANLSKTLASMNAFAFAKHAPYSLSLDVDELCEQLTRIIFANTFRQLDMQLFADESLNATGKEYIEKMQHSRVINICNDLKKSIEQCKNTYPNL